MPFASIDAIRSHFPALERTHDDHPVAYFDGPGGTQVPRAVSEAMVDYLHHHNANTHWPYPTSAETDRVLEHARAVFAEFLNCGADEVVFGANMTTLTLHVSRALARSFPPGVEVVVTELDHHANSDPWRELARDQDLTVRTVRLVPGSGQLNWDDLEYKLSARTALLAIGAASNALGTITDVRRAADLAHRHGALVYVDGVHYAPHRLPDVSALGADFFVCSAYKFYGPHVGILYGRRDLQERLDPPRLVPAGQHPPELFESGTLNHEGIVGAARAVEWLASLAPPAPAPMSPSASTTTSVSAPVPAPAQTPDAVTGTASTRTPLRDRLALAYATLGSRGEGLVASLWDQLAGLDRVTLYGPAPGNPRTDTLVFTVAGVSSEEVARVLADRGVFCSCGDFYAPTVVSRLGLGPDGLVRAGCACYTTDDEVARLVDGVRRLR